MAGGGGVAEGRFEYWNPGYRTNSSKPVANTCTSARGMLTGNSTRDVDRMVACPFAASVSGGLEPGAKPQSL